MQGLHLTADLYGCGCDSSLLIDADKLDDRQGRVLDGATAQIGELVRIDQKARITSASIQVSGEM